MIKTLEDLRLIALPLGAVGAFQRNRTKGVVCCDVSYVYEIECRHLTPPPSSTNVERLFSYGGLVATDHRASLSGEKLDQILFLRENALMANFDLGWL